MPDTLLICMFTDSLVEARRAGELFGPTGWRPCWRSPGPECSDIAMLLAAEARRFEGHNLADDPPSWRSAPG